jgi:argininosuccinate lyase
MAAKSVLGRLIGIDESALRAALDPSRIVATRTVTGGSAPERVKEHAQAVRQRIRTAGEWREERRTRINTVEAAILAAAENLAAPVGHVESITRWWKDQ